MADRPTPEEIDLETFLKSASQSFTDAQRSLLPGLDVSVNMMLSNAELELKVAVSSDVQGKMSIRPISSEDILRGGIDPGVLSTIRITFVSSVGEFKAEAPPASADTAGRGEAVPALVGLTLDEAGALLKSRGWQFEPHAASSDEIAAAGKESRGRVLRQEPQASRPADKAKTAVHFWVDLGNVPVKAMDGIGEKLGDSLSRVGINTLGELSLTSVARIAAALNTSESRARNFLDMAVLMSRLAVLGFRDEVAELLVKGASIRSMEQLAGADPEELYRVCREAVASGKVRTPRGFSFTLDDTRDWVRTARSQLGK